jgi:hypothetical protein
MPASDTPVLSLPVKDVDLPTPLSHRSHTGSAQLFADYGTECAARQSRSTSAERSHPTPWVQRSTMWHLRRPANVVQRCTTPRPTATDVTPNLAAILPSSRPASNVVEHGSSCHFQCPSTRERLRDTLQVTTVATFGQCFTWEPGRSIKTQRSPYPAHEARLGVGRRRWSS